MSGDEREDRAERRELTKKLDNLERQVAEQFQLISDTVEEHGNVIYRIDGDMTDGRGANVPLVPFSGNRNEDFSQYLKQFELICAANNYAADKKAQILASHLKDKAFYVYDSLPAATKSDFDALKAALTEKFQTSDYKRYLHQKFQERKQKINEDVTSYGCDVHKLGMAALASIDSDQRDALIREKFIAGLRPDLHKLIVYSDPKSFHDAMTLAERLEGLQLGEVDNGAKHTLLLEAISNRLQKLEVTALEPQTPQHQWSCALAAPHQPTNGNPMWNPRAANLSNYRQAIGPRGNICFRCNRSGHIARSCPQAMNTSTIICRHCNRPGHFARDCQRRLSRNRYQGNPNRPPPRRPLGQRPNPARFPNNFIPRRNEAMATINEENEDHAPESRWQPLVAALITSDTGNLQRQDRRNRRCALQLRDHNNNVFGTEIRPAKEQSPSTQRISSKQLDFENNRSSRKRTSNSTVDRKSVGPPKKRAKSVPNLQGIRNPHFTSRNDEAEMPPPFSQEGRNSMNYFRPLRIGKYASLTIFAIIFLWFANSAEGFFNAYGNSTPMICQAQESKALWKLPNTFVCPEGNHTVEGDVKPVALKLFKHNYIQYQSKGWKCIKIKKEVETFTYFFGDENLKTEKITHQPVSAEECVSMSNFKRCNGQPMAYTGGIYQTNNKLTWYYPGGGINCCHWKKFTITNCFMYRTYVYKRHNTARMESGAGDVSRCTYVKGQCVMENGAFLIWEVNNLSFCDHIEWKTIKGKMYGSSWISDDSNLALTFTRKGKAKDCSGRELMMSDQGIAVRPLNIDGTSLQAQLRQKRQVLDAIDRNEKKQNLNNGGGFVSSAQLAASLEALELKWRQNTQFAFMHALNSVCHFMRSVVELLKTQILANPTMAVRALVNQSAMFVKAGGHLLEIFPCRELNRGGSEFKFVAMNDTCSAQIPIKFYVQNREHLGYLDPVTNIIHRYTVPIDCSMVRQIPLQLRGRHFLYQAKTGELEPISNIPTLKVLQWNSGPYLDLHSTIFHEIVIYTWDELQTHISLNDIIGSLNKQRTVLKHMGISEEEIDNPKEAAGAAVSNIMSKGYFGFLHGLAANAYQIWTFVVCLYVTIGVAVVHFFPINAMPAGLNFANAFRRIKNIWTRWRYRERQWYEATGETAPQRWLNVRLANRNRSASDANRYVANMEPRPRHLQLPAISPPGPTTPALVGVLPETTKIPTFGTFLRTPNFEIRPFRVNASGGEATVSALIDGLQVRTLMDSGSNLTIVPRRIALQLRNAIRQGPVTAISMTGHQLPIVGEVEAVIRLGKKDPKGRVVVADKAPYDLIIGTDLMKQLGKVQFDFKRQVIQAGVDKMPMQIGQTPAGVYLCQGIRMPPKSQAIVMGFCYGIAPCDSYNTHCCYFSPGEKLLNKYEVIGHDSLVNPTEKLVPILLSNPSPTPKFLPSKATLGCLSEIHNGDLTHLQWPPKSRKEAGSDSKPRSPEELVLLRQQLNTGSTLTTAMRGKLEEVIVGYEELFAKGDYDLGETHLLEHEINTGNARPHHNRDSRCSRSTSHSAMSGSAKRSRPKIRTEQKFEEPTAPIEQIPTTSRGYHQTTRVYARRSPTPAHKRLFWSHHHRTPYNRPQPYQKKSRIVRGPLL